LSTISSSGWWLVAVVSLESKEKLPFVLVRASPTPLLVTVPVTQLCTSEVMSTTTNWLLELVVSAMGLPLVAEAPRGGALLYVNPLSVQLAFNWYTSKLPPVTTPSTNSRRVALLTLAPAGNVYRLNLM
jgi:hypothetical protein